MAAEDEQGEIERDFAESWDEIERFFQWHSSFPSWIWLKPILDLIAELRKRGYDTQFRAGQQKDRLLLSRSRERELRSEQARIYIELMPNGRPWVRYYQLSNVDIQLNIEHVEITPGVEDLLKRLLAQPID